MKNYFLLLFIVANLYFVQTYAQTGISIPELSSLDTQISRFMRRYDLPGGSVALVKNGRLIYARGFGNADTDMAVNPDHLFRIASLSKPITSLAIMKLVQEGQLSLGDYVFGEKGILNSTEFKNIADSRIRKITVQHLLQHTAGWDRELNRGGDPMFNSINISTIMAAPAPANSLTVIQYILTQPLDFEPGTQYAYSNIGYCILGRVIEKITGMKYENYVNETILYPLGIYNMRLGRNLYENKDSKEVRYYDYPERPLAASVCEIGREVTYPYGGFNLEAMDAHGGWIASASDLAKLMIACDGFASRPDFLSSDIIHTMVTPSDQNPNYAMGWCVNATGNWWHSGSLVGSSAYMARLQNDIIWVVLFNGNPQTQSYFRSLDKLMWSALEKITEWPSHDLFEMPFADKFITNN